MTRFFGTAGNDTLVGDNGNNELFGLNGDDTLIGSLGSDLLDGGNGFNTADYSRLTAQLTLKPTGTLEKAGIGTDRLNRMRRIIGSNNFNIIDAESITGGTANLDVNLAQGSVVVRDVPGVGTISLSVVNFNWVIGTANADRLVGGAFSDLLRGVNGNDTIVGGGADDILIGDGGNDVVQGQAGNDRLLGSDNTTRGRNEIDVVSGGAGNDTFVLGSRSGTFFGLGGNGDFQRIPDFNPGDRFELGINQTYRAERTGQGFNLFAIRSGIRDLVAEVTTTGFVNLPTSNFTITASQGVGIFAPSNSFG
jgi:Ca2+-binding RTX toxin-like protein